MDWKELWRDVDIQLTPTHLEDAPQAKALEEMLNHAMRNPETLPPDIQQALEQETKEYMRKMWHRASRDITRPVLHYLLEKSLTTAQESGK